MLSVVSQAVLGFVLVTSQCNGDTCNDKAVSEQIYPTIMACEAGASLVQPAHVLHVGCGMVISGSAPTVFDAIDIARGNKAAV